MSTLPVIKGVKNEFKETLNEINGFSPGGDYTVFISAGGG
jgi:hypothetical protein